MSDKAKDAKRDRYIPEFNPATISNSCVPCNAVTIIGDCCGILYWENNDIFKCNECGQEFDIKEKP